MDPHKRLKMLEDLISSKEERIANRKTRYESRVAELQDLWDKEEASYIHDVDLQTTKIAEFRQYHNDISAQIAAVVAAPAVSPATPPPSADPSEALLNQDFVDFTRITVSSVMAQYHAASANPDPSSQALFVSNIASLMTQLASHPAAKQPPVPVDSQSQTLTNLNQQSQADMSQQQPVAVDPYSAPLEVPQTPAPLTPALDASMSQAEKDHTDQDEALEASLRQSLQQEAAALGSPAIPAKAKDITHSRAGRPFCRGSSGTSSLPAHSSAKFFNIGESSSGNSEDESAHRSRGKRSNSPNKAVPSSKYRTVEEVVEVDDDGNPPLDVGGESK